MNSTLVHTSKTGDPDHRVTAARMAQVAAAAGRSARMRLVVAELILMRDHGAQHVGAKTCFDEGGKWRRTYALNADTDLLALAQRLFPTDGSTEVWYFTDCNYYIDLDGTRIAW